MSTDSTFFCGAILAAAGLWVRLPMAEEAKPEVKIPALKPVVEVPKEPPAVPVEKRLEKEEAEKVLTELSDRFFKQTYLRAKIAMDVDDLLGRVTKLGVLLIKRPDKVMRQFDGAPNTHIVWLFDGRTSMEFNNATKKVSVRDFSKAPKKQELFRAAMTVDLPKLQVYFDIAVYKKEGLAEAPAEFRFVLTPNPAAGNPLHFERIQLLLTDGAPFFRQVDRIYQANKGNSAQERYFEIKEEQSIPDQEFRDPLLERSLKEIERVTDEPVKK